MTFTPLETLMRRPAVQAVTGFSRSGLYAAMARNDFPKPVQLGPQSVAWRQSEVQAWIASRERVAA
jgi:prophage regulatory protein